MTLPKYIEQTRTTDLVNTVRHAALGLISEVGEVYGVLAKIERGDKIDRAERMTGELGDVAWYLARLCDLYLPNADLTLDNRFRDTYSAKDTRCMCSLLYWYADAVLRAKPFDRLAEQEIAWAGWARLCSIEGLDPALVLESNLAKLRDRAARKVLQGDGDHR
jgi:NTP pyrophosphatase (non-canonical NTP hydrolase)